MLSILRLLVDDLLVLLFMQFWPINWASLFAQLILLQLPTVSIDFHGSTAEREEKRTDGKK